jgi:hypothetical protein
MMLFFLSLLHFVPLPLLILSQSSLQFKHDGTFGKKKFNLINLKELVPVTKQIIAELELNRSLLMKSQNFFRALLTFEQNHCNVVCEGTDF